MASAKAVSVRVLAFAKGEKLQEAEEAGADYAGAEELIEKVKGGWIEFDRVVTTLVVDDVDDDLVLGVLDELLVREYRPVLPRAAASEVLMPADQDR